MKIITKNTQQIPIVLLVDDQASVAIVVKKILGAYCEILFASTLKKAHELMATVEVDLILLDIELQGETGWDFIEQLKDRSEISELPPIMFVTSHNDRELEEKALELGAIDFILKPILPSVLRLRVLNLLRLKFQERQILAYTSQLKEIAKNCSFRLSCWGEDWSCMYLDDREDKRDYSVSLYLKDYFSESLSKNIMDLAVIPGVYEFQHRDVVDGEERSLEVTVIRKSSRYFDDYILIKIME